MKRLIALFLCLGALCPCAACGGRPEIGGIHSKEGDIYPQNFLLMDKAEVEFDLFRYYYLNYKNMPLLQLILNALPLAFGYAVKTRFFKKRGFGKEYKEGLKEGFATLDQCHRVPFRLKNLGHYLRIEWELIYNTFIYAYEYAKRRKIRL